MTDLPNPVPACDLIKEGGGDTCPAGLPVPRGTVLTRRTLRSVAILVIIGFLVTSANLLFTAHEVAASHAAQQRQGQVIEQKLCTTFGKLAALMPPAGNPRVNPSRAYLQDEHATLVQLGADLGCKGAAR